MGIFYPDEIIEEVRTSVDIVDVISEHVQLKKSGRNYFGLCPFHNEKTPSFSVSQEKQIFHCFGCNEGGNVIRFLMKIESLDFVEAVELLAKRVNIELPQENISDEVKRKISLKETIYKINTETAMFYHQNLISSQGEIARSYITSRGIDNKTVKKFGLGFSLNQPDSLNRYLLNKGFSQDLIFKAGLVKKSNRHYVDSFRGRLMFPIFDLRSNIIAFGGRSLGDYQPKYLNSPETLIFNKRQNLYGLNFAPKTDNNKLIIVEGYMDVLALHQYGINNAVASLGTALTQDQAKLINKYCDEVVVAYDSDNAGQNATIRSIDILRNSGCNIKILELPQGKDPDDYIRKYGKDKFNNLVSKAKTYIQFKIDLLRLKDNLDTVDGKIDFLNKASDIIAKVDNAIERDVYINILSNQTGISTDSIIAQINKKLYKGKGTKIIAKKKNNITMQDQNQEQKLDTAEKMLIYILCQEGIYKKYSHLIDINLFTVEQNKRLLSEIIKVLSNGKEVEPAELMTNLKSEEDEKMISKLFSTDIIIDDLDKAVFTYINYINDIKVKEKISDVLKSHGEILDSDISAQRELNELIKIKNIKTSEEGR